MMPPRADNVVNVKILIATDADWVVDDITAALGAEGVTFVVCREGRVVADQIAQGVPDIAICDMQIGSMGGIAVTMSLRLDESSGALPHVPVLMLLDRTVDLHLARRSGAEGWLIKPLDSLRLKRAVKAILAGESYTEGVPAAEVLADYSASETGDGVGLAENDADSTEEETVTAG